MRKVERIFADDPTPEQQAADDQVEVVRTAEIWFRTPTVFAESKEYLTRHYKLLDPAKPRRFSDFPVEDAVSVVSLVQAPTEHTGRTISLLGHLQDANILDSVPGEDGFLRTWILQIGVVSIEATPQTPVVYCRGLVLGTINRGDWVVCQGVAVAAGQISSAAGGFAAGAYMLGQAALVTPTREEERTFASREGEALSVLGTHPP